MKMHTQAHAKVTEEGAEMDVIRRARSYVSDASASDIVQLRLNAPATSMANSTYCGRWKERTLAMHTGDRGSSRILIQYRLKLNRRADIM